MQKINEQSHAQQEPPSAEVSRVAIQGIGTKARAGALDCVIVELILRDPEFLASTAPGAAALL